MHDPNCLFCRPEVLNGPTFIADMGNWVLLLNKYQFLPGTCLLVLKEHKEGLSSLTETEAAEAHSNLKRVETVLKAAFSPDWFNYLQTNNTIRHLHFHIIPRYAEPVHFMDEAFTDENYRGMPVESERVLPETIMSEMISTIRSNI